MLKLFRKHTKIIIWLVIIAFGGWGGYAVGTQFSSQGRYAGNVFGEPVTFQEFNRFYHSTQIFAGADPLTDPELIKIKTWQNIILSKEAKQNKVEVSDQEVRDEIARLLKDQDIEAPSAELYEKWVRTVLRETPKDFEEQVREIIRTQKLIKKITAGVTTEPSEEEVRNQFLREQRSLSLEFFQFPTEDEALAFQSKLGSEENWAAQKEESKDLFRETGKVAMDAIINLWRIPEDKAQGLFEMEIDSFSGVTPIHDKFGLFKIVDKVYEDEEKWDAEKYKERITNRQFQAFMRGWSQDLQERAALEDLLPKAEPVAAEPSEATDTNTENQLSEGDVPEEILAQIKAAQAQGPPKDTESAPAEIV